MTDLIQTMNSEGMLILQYLSVRSLLGGWLRDCLSLKRRQHQKVIKLSCSDLRIATDVLLISLRFLFLPLVLFPLALLHFPEPMLLEFCYFICCFLFMVAGCCVFLQIKKHSKQMYIYFYCVRLLDRTARILHQAEPIESLISLIHNFFGVKLMPVCQPVPSLLSVIVFLTKQSPRGLVQATVDDR